MIVGETVRVTVPVYAMDTRFAGLTRRVSAGVTGEIVRVIDANCVIVRFGDDVYAPCHPSGVSL